ncbi:MAG TPA: 3-deoxy-7-phosphoheptulonate synthase, partial [Gammaproteobacteria bacterium]
MIIIMNSDVTDQQIDGVVRKLKDFGLDSNVSRGIERTVIGAIGDETRADKELLQALPGVEDVIRVMKPYKIVARSYHKEDTVIDIAGVKL